MIPGLPPPFNLLVAVIELGMRCTLSADEAEAKWAVADSSRARHDEGGFVAVGAEAGGDEETIDHNGHEKTDWTCGYCLSSNSKYTKQQVLQRRRCSLGIR